MSDLLVSLYDLPQSTTCCRDKDIVIRRALVPERHIIRNWVMSSFNEAWAEEADVAMCRSPAAVWVGVKEGELLGFACYDATAKGFFGPIGVRNNLQRGGLGGDLLMATLKDMYSVGYHYAIIGGAGQKQIAFYSKYIDILEIPYSSPGIYKDMMKN